MNTLLDPADAGATDHEAIEADSASSQLQLNLPGLSRRGFIRGLALAGGGLLAAACGPVAANWTFGPVASAAPSAALPSGATSATLSLPSRGSMATRSTPSWGTSWEPPTTTPS